jgi:hypothetical protein
VTTTSLVATTTTTTVKASTTTTTARATTTTARQAAATTLTTQQQTTTTLAPPGSNVLVPGDGTEGAQSTTTTVATATKVNDGGPSDGTLIGLVIAGLILIAVAVAVLTWRYWVATRPPVVDTASTPKPRPTPARTG